MPETDQASQFITALEPFYKVAYVKEEKVPPIFNIFCKKHNIATSNKMNGHASPIKENGGEHTLNTSHASALHNINGHKELNEVKPDPFNEDGIVFIFSLPNVTSLNTLFSVVEYEPVVHKI